MKKSQISMEYLIVVGFVTFIIVGVLVIASVYSGAIRDKIKMTQLSDFANKITSTAEYVFYAGQPSKATIVLYLPEGVSSIEITANSIIFKIDTSSGVNTIGFLSKVPLTGSIGSSQGLKRIQVQAQEEGVLIIPA